jgi:hypothetical protein
MKERRGGAVRSLVPRDWERGLENRSRPILMKKGLGVDGNLQGLPCIIRTYNLQITMIKVNWTKVAKVLKFAATVITSVLSTIAVQSCS